MAEQSFVQVLLGLIEYVVRQFFGIGGRASNRVSSPTSRKSAASQSGIGAFDLSMLRCKIETTIQMNLPNNIQFTIDDYFQCIDWMHAVICSECGKKVIDPDKKRNQLFLKGTCPSCDKHSQPPPPAQPSASEKKSKRQLKRERKLALKEQLKNLVR